MECRWCSIPATACCNIPGVTAATPNEPEVEEALGVRIGHDWRTLCSAAEQVMSQMKLQSLVITRGRDGMVAFTRRQKPADIPIFGSDQVADVTGAGDTVIATFTAALAAGASAEDAAHLANYAGGIVVMKRGTATVSQQELLEALDQAAAGAASPIDYLGARLRCWDSRFRKKTIANKILTRAELQQQVAEWRQAGDSITLANGAFDLLHVGHVRYLHAAKASGRTIDRGRQLGRVRARTERRRPPPDAGRGARRNSGGAGRC